MSPRLRRRITRISAAVGAAAAVLALSVAFALHRTPADHNLDVVAVESRAGAAATTEADLAAELGQAKARGGALLLTAIADQTAAPALDTDLACPAGSDPISCDQLHQRQTTRAEAVADTLATTPRPAHVDLYALFSQLSGYLQENPTANHAQIDVYVNTLGDADTPQNLVTANLASPAVVATLTRQAITEGAFPGPDGCRDWQVHMVVPATAQPAHDLGLRDLLSALLTQCGGTLASWTPRWLAPSNTPLALPPIPGIPTPGPQQAQPTYTLPDTLFAVGSATITPAGQTALTQVAVAILARYPGRPFTCAGSADGTGGNSPTVLTYDQTLSSARATAVCDYLVAQGLAAPLAHPTGLGQTTPPTPPPPPAVSIIIHQ